jgi:hypothetical protein
MKIELKKISIIKKFSQETIMFMADIYIDDVKAGHAQNDGHGGSCFYHSYLGQADLIKSAEVFLWNNGRKTLDDYIDNEINIASCKKQAVRDMEKGILIGKSFETYEILSYSKPIKKLTPSLRQELYDQVKKMCIGDKKILNANLEKYGIVI